MFQATLKSLCRSGSILAVLAAAGVASQASAATITVNATKLCGQKYWVENWGDAWLTDAEIQEGNYPFSAFLKFEGIDLAALGTINSATLTVVGENGNDSGDPYGPGYRKLDGVTADVFATTNNWDPANGKNPYVTASTTAYSLTGVAGQYYATADVTPILSDAVTYGLRIVDPDGDWVSGLRFIYKSGAVAVNSGGAYDMPSTANINTSITIDYTPMPEPTSLALLPVCGLLGLRRRRSCR